MAQRQVILIGLCLLIAATIVAGPRIAPRWLRYSMDRGSLQRESILAKSGRALADKRFDVALRLAKEWLARDPNCPRGLIHAAAACREMKNYSDALEFLSRIPDGDNLFSVVARTRSAEIFLYETYSLENAERQLERALALEPDNVRAIEVLIDVMRYSGRDWQAIPLQLRLVRLGVVNRQLLYHLSMHRRVGISEKFLDRCREANDGSALVLTGFAHNAQRADHWDEVKSLLQRAIAADPTYIEARVRLGGVLNVIGTESEMREWLDKLPEEATKHPNYWVHRGDWAHGHDQSKEAVRCYWEAIQRDSAHQRAHSQLGQILTRLGENALADVFHTRARKLETYFNAVEDASERAREPGRQARDLDISEQAGSLSLLWEAHAWERLSGKRLDQSTATMFGLSRFRSSLDEMPVESRLVEAGSLPSIDLTRYPLPSSRSGEVSLGASPIVASQKHKVRFSNDAHLANLTFNFMIGQDPEFRGIQKVFSLTGGGVGVLDFDRDGWPDVYLTQGGRNPRAPSGAHLDRLFHNREGQFTDATESSGIHESEYSQGIAIGDIDQDGFEDIVVANIGQNRLYMNNGDGTFREHPLPRSDDPDEWSTSCLIADLNGDTIPDIYFVNYLSGDFLTRECRNVDGNVVAMCHPRAFPAAIDRLLLGEGDGQFRDATSSSGIVNAEGRGLGVVAADFSHSGRLDVFVANDSVANSFFASRGQPSAELMPFADESLLRGVAYNMDGRGEACMGVACGDLDGDGQLDLFVTNFANESNTFYRQEQDGAFSDATSRSRLGEASYSMLGFGTQCIDGDLDGDLDLIVTNGAVDVSASAPYEMPSQYFENLGRGVFEARIADEIGPFFAEKHLGRGMARLDWNRDGREDVVISHSTSPAALLTNRSPTTGHHLVVRLVGVKAARDPIGTVVRLEVGGRALVRQLTAGDGYQASNERRLVFGTGTAVHIDEMRVTWPDQATQSFRGFAVDQEVICVEGREQFFTIERHRKIPHDE